MIYTMDQQMSLVKWLPLSVIEWQKRGPHHAHILGICDEETKPRTPEDYDNIVCAEIPDEKQFPELYKTYNTHDAQPMWIR